MKLWPFNRRTKIYPVPQNAQERQDAIDAGWKPWGDFISDDVHLENNWFSNGADFRLLARIREGREG